MLRAVVVVIIFVGLLARAGNLYAAIGVGRVSDWRRLRLGRLGRNVERLRLISFVRRGLRLPHVGHEWDTDALVRGQVIEHAPVKRALFVELLKRDVAVGQLQRDFGKLWRVPITLLKLCE